jgi:ABC-type antimicrobial peptide transport system permease subunit
MSALLEAMHERGELVPAIDAYLSAQPFREAAIRAAVEWLFRNRLALARLNAAEIGAALAEAFPELSDRETLSVVATIKSIVATAGATPWGAA